MGVINPETYTPAPAAIAACQAGVVAFALVGVCLGEVSDHIVELRRGAEFNDHRPRAS